MKTTIKIEDVLSVYSGINGKCCCGCAGKHSYRKASQKEGSAHRGYEVLDNEVNERMVKKVVNLLNEHADEADWLQRLASVVIGQRLYIVYFNEVGKDKPEYPFGRRNKR